MPSQKPLLHLIADPAFVEVLDRFHHRYRFSSRTRAALFLMQWAIKHGAKPEPEDLKPPRRGAKPERK